MKEGKQDVIGRLENALEGIQAVNQGVIQLTQNQKEQAATLVCEIMLAVDPLSVFKLAFLTLQKMSESTLAVSEDQFTKILFQHSLSRVEMDLLLLQRGIVK